MTIKELENILAIDSAYPTDWEDIQNDIVMEAHEDYITVKEVA